MKKTKIVCTMGPAVDDINILSGLLKAGMNVARMNFSHGSHDEHKKRMELVRQASKETGIPVAILLDTKGPEIRTRNLKDGKEVTLIAGQEFIITTDDIVGDNTKVSVTYENFVQDLKLGDIILIDDGLIEMVVEKIEGNNVISRVLNNGVLGEKKGVNLPNVAVNLPALAENDIKDLEFGCRMGVDFVAASFIRKMSDVKEVKDILEKNGGTNIKIISKIENQEGLNNFEEILEISDGIMVARGDLGVEIPIEKIPLAQKEMIALCNQVGKPVITATQMLESMIKNPRPTRAEITDVANAIFDGTDAVMLSGETAKGAFPVEAVKVMQNIAREVDPLIEPIHASFEEQVNIAEAIARGTVEVALACSAKVIVLGTHTGRAAAAVRQYFPQIPVLALADNELVARQLLLLRGVYSEVANPHLSDHEDFADFALQKAQEIFNLSKGDRVVLSYGRKIYTSGTTNSIRVLTIE